MTDTSDSRMPRDDGADDQHSLGHLFRGWLRSAIRGRGDNTLRDTIEELIEDDDESESSMGAGERTLLANILKLRDRTVVDVMVPRADIVGIDVDTPLPALIQRMSDEAHSRLPVYRETLDDVVGMVHIKDVLACVASQKAMELKDIVRDVSIVAPSMPVLDLLLQMRQTRQHMALVVDEFGGIDGLVTIEDLVEEIVGEIEDEHDEAAQPRLVERPDGSLIADARISIEDFEARVGPVLTEEEREDIDTLGGLVVSLAGRVPGRGELLKHPSGLEFEIVEADPRRIKRLRVRNMPANINELAATG
ncbi:hemolysin family protein [Azospirillum sp. TSO22-1]|uniref:hemolysin family protein n=1 Tax=Azospirillum sp. TSO22-1 TaxID=716789 RepID=UPI000D610083|nr:hemolysin family protein [Azospirillum sp. TSO22-1]PWC41325.1 hemolysin C [Azospirillum sp. TSO22-1]